MNRRTFLKTTLATGAALAVGSQLGGLGKQSSLLRQIKPSEAATVDVGKYVVTVTNNGGAHYTYVKNGVVIRPTPIPVPLGSSYPAYNVNGSVFSPPMKTNVGANAIAYREYTYATGSPGGQNN